MRTTLTLDPDIASMVKQCAAKLRKPLKEVINAAQRVGLDKILASPPARPYRTKARPLGLRRGFSYDDVSELLARTEGGGSRVIQTANQHWPLFQQMLRTGNATAHLVSDAHLAALAVEHNCVLHSTDADFARFHGLKWKNPIGS